MIKQGLIAGLVASFAGCAVPSPAWKGTVEWPEDERTIKTIVPLIEAGAALAAAAAVREMVRTNDEPRVFRGCSSPEQGLDVAVYTGPAKGLYYVVLEQRFHRCGGPSGRVLDWHYVYAVTPQGEVVARAEPLAATEDAVSPPPEQVPAPGQPSPAEGVPSPAGSPPGNGSTEPPTEIRWPENLAPLAVLDGPALAVADIARRHVLAQRLYPAGCEPSAEALKATVGYQEPLYYVRIEANAERCNQEVPGVEPQPGWFKVYAFFPNWRMVAPNPPPP
jgi:hypothetical protein